MFGADVVAYQRRLTAFGWRTIVIDGHDMRQIVDALRRARRARQAPVAIVARTVKGKGIEGIEDADGWHGKPLPSDVAERAIAALEAGLHHIAPPPIRRPARNVKWCGFGGLTVLRASERDRLAIVAAGITLHEALAAHDELARDGLAVRVIDLYGVKPVDVATLRRAAATGGNEIVTVEDHYAEGGLGDAVTEAVAEVGIVVHRLAVREIPHSGPGPMLLERYGIGRRAVVQRNPRDPRCEAGQSGLTSAFFCSL